jgi:competence protein ComEA
MPDERKRSPRRSEPQRTPRGVAWPWTADVRRLLALATLPAGLALGIVGRGAGPEASPVAAPELVVDLNTAPAEIFSALPGIGPKLAARIVEARREAPFASLDDLDRRVRGIGPAVLARLAPHLRVEPTPERVE